MQRRTLALATLAALPCSLAHAGATIELAPDKSLTIGLLVQPQLRLEQEDALAVPPALSASGNAGSLTFDPFVRRTRLLLSGQYTELIKFFVETDQPNWGRRGDWTPNFYLQDVWVEFNIHRALQLDVGMLLLPTCHQGAQGGGSLLLADYHLDLIKLPMTTARAWRDVGVMARGEFFDGHLEYRAALTNGIQAKTGWDAQNPSPRGPLNPGDAPLLSGRLVGNIFDSEAGSGVAGFFYDGLYLKQDGDRLISPQRILSFGASSLYQPDSVYGGYDGRRTGFLMLAGDLFADYPIGDGNQAINAQLDLLFYDFGPQHLDTGRGVLVEVGYRFDRVEPVAGFDWYDAVNADDHDLIGLRGGVNWWLYGHDANLKFELGGQRLGGDDQPLRVTALLQAQLAI